MVARTHAVPRFREVEEDIEGCRAHFSDARNGEALNNELEMGGHLLNRASEDQTELPIDFRLLHAQLRAASDTRGVDGRVSGWS